MRGIVRHSGGGEFSEANRRSVVRSQLRSPKGAGDQSLGQRPRNYGEGRFSQACDEFVLGVPAADCGRLDEAKARDPERSLTGKTSGEVPELRGRRLVWHFNWEETQGVALGFGLSPLQGYWESNR